MSIHPINSIRELKEKMLLLNQAAITVRFCLISIAFWNNTCTRQAGDFQRQTRGICDEGFSSQTP